MHEPTSSRPHDHTLNTRVYRRATRHTVTMMRTTHPYPHRGSHCECPRHLLRAVDCILAQGKNAFKSVLLRSARMPIAPLSRWDSTRF